MSAHIVITEIPAPVPHDPPTRTGATPLAEQLLSKLSGLTNGAGVSTTIPDGISQKSVCQSLRALATAAGIGISLRTRGGRLCAYRTELPPRTAHTSADEMLTRRVSGETLESIAQDFGITRERVRQITTGYMKFSSLPIGDRVAAVDDFLRAYIAQTPDKPSCILCQGESGYGLICRECRMSVRALRRAAARLRAYRASGKRHYLGKAIMDIRRHNLTPEDMKRG